MTRFDVIIIGAGVVGCATARALSRHALNILVIEQGADVSIGASKANSGILHAGYDCKPNTKKAALNLRGLSLYQHLLQELHIPHRFNGSLVVSHSQDGKQQLEKLYAQGMANGVSNLALLNAAQTHHLEPQLHADINASLHAPTAGIISPYEATVAFAESAALNKVQFKLGTCVTGIAITPPPVCSTALGSNECFVLTTTAGYFHAQVVINTAGVASAAIAQLLQETAEVGALPTALQPQRGQYYVLDNTQQALITRTLFQLPTEKGKGVLVAPTVDGNILIGPTAESITDPLDTSTTKEGLREALDKVRYTLGNVPISDRITAFAGVRAKSNEGDFIIEEVPCGFIHAIGIDSPGLTAAPAIAEALAEKALDMIQPMPNRNFIAERPPLYRMRDLPPDVQNSYIANNPAYGNVICRCENITQGEIQEAMRRFDQLQRQQYFPSQPTKGTLPCNFDALKRRTRVQMGRCQGGFCTLRLMELISRNYQIPEAQVSKNGTNSETEALT